MKAIRNEKKHCMADPRREDTYTKHKACTGSNRERVIYSVGSLMQMVEAKATRYEKVDVRCILIE